MINVSAMAGTTWKSRDTAVHFSLKGSHKQREQRPQYTWNVNSLRDRLSYYRRQ